VENSGSESYAEIRNRQGKTLRGMLHRPAGVFSRPRAPGVVMFHGFTGDRMESHWIFVKCSRALAEEGIASFRFDFSGSGESDGDFREVTVRGEIAEGRAAVEFFRGQNGIDAEHVGLLGFSMGGAVAAALAPSLEVQALVLWSALAHTARLRELMVKLTKPIPGKPAAVEYDAREISVRFMDDALKVEPIRHLKQYKGPTLILHPGKDESVPASHARDFYRACGAKTKDLVVIPGADHVFTSLAWEREVITRTVEWFGRYL
jgi:hypothetical protein